MDACARREKEAHGNVGNIFSWRTLRSSVDSSDRFQVEVRATHTYMPLSESMTPLKPSNGSAGVHACRFVQVDAVFVSDINHAG